MSSKHVSTADLHMLFVHRMTAAVQPMISKHVSTADQHMLFVHRMTAAMQPDALQACEQSMSAYVGCAQNDSSHAAR